MIKKIERASNQARGNRRRSQILLTQAWHSRYLTDWILGPGLWLLGWGFMRGSFSTERLGVDLGRLRSTSNGQAYCQCAALANYPGHSPIFTYKFLHWWMARPFANRYGHLKYNCYNFLESSSTDLFIWEDIKFKLPFAIWLHYVV